MKIGLALSGGAARGVAHLGVLKAFEELDIKIDIVSGVSSGAIAGVFYAAGFSPDEILKLIKELSVFKIARPIFGKMGLMHLDEVEKLFCKYLGPNAVFEDLKFPVIISATEMNEGVTAYFSSGNLIKPLLATLAVPILYQPVSYNNKLLCDGGLLNNMPIDPLHCNCDVKIGVHVNPINHNADLKSIRSMVERSVQLGINNNVKLRLHLCDLLLEPQELKHYRLTSFRKADEIFEIGYRYTLNMEKHIRHLLQNFKA
ncbi:patatin-like phospholipase family protein [Pontibacter qinzhouensis]|uniref:Patatin-like phospholipase family protein n=1 Tax=Pontibacter qinzhouensis TaxID=2603253 RepID=A0A5C8KBM9_9BACT|nr:patatin-like phospholipase family protein [Pontibacter qinzhouensis]TXK47667.1 patatin-like phospholipase family protein [Pontibacter qinzhouensis]